MKTINSVSGLKLAIIELELSQAKDWKELKFETVRKMEALKPVNIIKQSIKDVLGSDQTKTTVLSNVVGLATGFASKALYIQNSTNPIKRLLGTALQLSLTKLISKNPSTVNKVVEGLKYFMRPSIKKISETESTKTV